VVGFGVGVDAGARAAADVGAAAALPRGNRGRNDGQGGPEGPGEVALGAQTLRELGVAIGDSVTARTPAGATKQLEVVGQSVFPSLTLNASGGISLRANVGGMMTQRLLLEQEGVPVRRGRTRLDAHRWTGPRRSRRLGLTALGRL